MLRGKFIDLPNIYKEKEMPIVNCLCIKLKKLKENQQIKPNKNGKQEIIQIRF